MGVVCLLCPDDDSAMLTHSAFGQTWWGKQWLNALTQIDFANRLPRGRSYAKKGAVRNLTVSGGTILASVQGSRIQPYRVTITVPPIAARAVTRLLDRIAADPALIAQMLNRQLDPAVLALASELGIAVFPTRWQDLDLRCSCPDWAVPCKHLAAAIYLLSREIDGNPFLVFSLRGIDLAAALKSRDIQLGQDAGSALPALSELLPTGDERVSAGDERVSADAELLDGIDFSLVPALSEPLLRVLSAQPPFFPTGDFRMLMGRLLARVSKAARQALAAAPGDETGGLSPDDRPCLVINSEYACTLSGVAGISDWPALLATLANLSPARLNLSPARLPDFQPELAALQPLRLLALHLLARGAVVPQIFSLQGHEAGLRWLPATLDPAVRELMQRVQDGLPPGRVLLRQGRKTLALSAEAQATTLCSLLLDHFIHAYCGAGQEKPAGDKTLALFFVSGRARSSSADARATTDPAKGRLPPASTPGWHAFILPAVSTRRCSASTSVPPAMTVMPVTLRWHWPRKATMPSKCRSLWRPYSAILPGRRHVSGFCKRWRCSPSSIRRSTAMSVPARAYRCALPPTSCRTCSSTPCRCCVCSASGRCFRKRWSVCCGHACHCRSRLRHRTAAASSTPMTSSPLTGGWRSASICCRARSSNGWCARRPA